MVLHKRFESKSKQPSPTAKQAKPGSAASFLSPFGAATDKQKAVGWDKSSKSHQIRETNVGQVDQVPCSVAFVADFEVGQVDQLRHGWPTSFSPVLSKDEVPSQDSPIASDVMPSNTKTPVKHLTHTSSTSHKSHSSHQNQI